MERLVQALTISHDKKALAVYLFIQCRVIYDRDIRFHKSLRVRDQFIISKHTHQFEN